MISRADITFASRGLQPYIRRTPIIECDLLNEASGGHEAIGFRDGPTEKLTQTRMPTITLKLELLQHTGSFKPRGAFNRLLRAAGHAPGIPTAGVITASGGNHGAAVAYAAKVLGLKAEIFVPANTPTAKVSRIEGYGAQVIQGGESYAEALVGCRARQAVTGALEVHAYDHEDVLAGQGTVGRELECAAPDLTHVLVATGGGGLIGGIAAWYAGSAAVISVEPEGCPTLHNALKAGHPVDCPVSGLAADALGARQVGALMFPIAQQYVSAAVLVTDAAIAAAQRWLWEQLRLIAEPGGATALAALMSGRFVPPACARVGVIVCGGNTSPDKIVPI